LEILREALTIEITAMPLFQIPIQEDQHLDFRLDHAWNGNARAGIF
jgi:hypothetical protein